MSETVHRVQRQQPRDQETMHRLEIDIPEYRFQAFERLAKSRSPNCFAPKTVKQLVERIVEGWWRPQPKSLYTEAGTSNEQASEDSKVGKRTMGEDSAFIVVMDYPGAEKGGMPRTFYRRLEKLQNISRLQKSVYEVISVTSMKRLVDLGRGFGFLVQAFKISHSCDNLKVNGAGNEVFLLHAEEMTRKL